MPSKLSIDEERAWILLNRYDLGLLEEEMIFDKEKTRIDKRYHRYMYHSYNIDDVIVHLMRQLHCRMPVDITHIRWQCISKAESYWVGVRKCSFLAS